MLRTATATLRAPLRSSAAAPLRVRALHSTLPRLTATPPTTDAGAYKNILVSAAGNGVTLITLNRPKALNALNSELFTELNEATAAADEDPSVGAIVITGSEKAFAAGADIKEMRNKEFAEAYKGNFLGHWTKISQIRKPIIAAVSGYALGGGCELAMMCDIILAAPNANFGQPEINLGVIPGAGGSQRLTHALGKSLSMEIVLTGKNVTADDAERHGLISRVVREGDVVEEAIKVGATIAKKGQVAVQAAKEAVNASFELPLAEGLRFERRLFQALFATKDQKEGMGAFAEKRKAKFTNE
ncbi:ClpP/crotonase [Tilletiopsis washingtonensis]|uniref:Probable enoyl-CoA hydratase, mitochondrial n=1 Tax=Tilletiopsis washingtonensis TaxID=58919 RepID=A0A316ZFZ8_9BASI|nr:ClpP/crotonase [Tilletiopsis washingtonensis]PWN99958.1 ClpP/crotonase [Tilletiopsis washingtonensis]